MKVRTIVLAVALATVSPALVSAQVRVGPMVGVSMLEWKDTSLSHGPLDDEVTLGRTWLLGAVVDMQLTSHQHLTFELAYGPYDNDVDRYCIYTFSQPAGCHREAGNAVSRALLYGVQYVRTFGRRSWRPYVGGGFGVKQYWYGSYGYDPVESSVAYTLSAAVGAESTHRVPVRLEFRTVFVTAHPLLYYQEDHQIELQARMTVFLAGHGRSHP
jgi:hypothetical protein